MSYQAPDDLGPLVSAAALDGFRGAPFADPVVEAAAETVRADCGWHIAPVATQTVRLRTGRMDSVNLPSLRVLEVLAVTDRDGNPVTGWDYWEHGVLDRPGGFPDTISVTFRHGY